MVSGQDSFTGSKTKVMSFFANFSFTRFFTEGLIAETLVGWGFFCCLVCGVEWGVFGGGWLWSVVVGLGGGGWCCVVCSVGVLSFLGFRAWGQCRNPAFFEGLGQVCRNSQHDVTKLSLHTQHGTGNVNILEPAGPGHVPSIFLF